VDVEHGEQHLAFMRGGERFDPQRPITAAPAKLPPETKAQGLFNSADRFD